MNDALFLTFLIYGAISGRPPHELVRPSLATLEESYVKEFAGVTMDIWAWTSPTLFQTIGNVRRFRAVAVNP